MVALLLVLLQLMLLVVDRGRSTGGLLKVKSNVNLGGAGGQGERGREHYGRTVSCP